MNKLFSGYKTEKFIAVQYSHSANSSFIVKARLQQDLVNIIIRFRKSKYGLVGDVVKMFRQVLIDKSQLDLHRVFYRPSEASTLQEYQLKTVTYGMRSATYTQYAPCSNAQWTMKFCFQ